MSELNDGIFYTTDECGGCFSCVRACPISGAAVILYKNAGNSENIIDLDDIENFSIDDLDSIDLENIAISEGDENSKYAVSIDADKCINCGKCMDICQRSAIKYRDDTELFFSDLASGNKSISVIISSSFYMNYPEKYENILGYLKSLGVNQIYHCDIGADINALATADYIKKNPDKTGLISSSCYPVVSYVEKYQNKLAEKLVPFQSDAVCTAIYARKYLNNNDRFAFIGSCIAKKAEFESPETGGYISYNVTVKNLMRKLAGTDISSYHYTDSSEKRFGALYTVPSGLKKNVNALLDNYMFIDSVSGADKIYDYIDNHKDNIRKIKKIPVLTDILSCKDGCMFSSVSCSRLNRYELKFNIDEYYIDCTDNYISKLDDKYSNILSDKFSGIDFSDFSRTFSNSSAVEYPEVSGQQIQEIFQSMKKTDAVSQNINCGACGYTTCRDMAMAIARGYDNASNCIHYIKEELSDNKKQIDFYQTELSSLVEEKTEQLEQFHDTMTTCIAELIDSRDTTDGKKKKITRKYFEVFIPAIASEEKYRNIFTKQFRADLLRGATLHNIGMAGISDSVLKKNGALEMNEFEHIKKHTEIGKQTFERIISQVTDASFLYVAKDMAYYHHEKWNGRGYPEGLKGEEIPLCARIMAIVDVYEALTSKKAYKKPFSHERSMEIIAEGRGTNFDPDLTDIFLSISDEINAVREHYNKENE